MVDVFDLTVLEKVVASLKWEHRFGWIMICKKLLEILKHNPDGIILDPIADESFISKKNIYKKPWVGFLHLTPSSPSYLESHGIDFLLRSECFQKSLPYNRGIFVLSEHLKKYLSSRLRDVIIQVIHHPSFLPMHIFDADKFINSKSRKLYHIGIHLRDPSKFYQLNVPKKYEKIIILKSTKDPRFVEPIRRANITDEQKKSVIEIKTLPDEEYDLVLSKNVLFVYLFDSSANNLIVEAIMARCPILVNRHPAVVEYLGQNYPFYYNTIDEAGIKLKNDALIKNTSIYLSTIWPLFTIENFLRTFINSRLILHISKTDRTVRTESEDYEKKSSIYRSPRPVKTNTKNTVNKLLNFFKKKDMQLDFAEKARQTALKKQINLEDITDQVHDFQNTYRKPLKPKKSEEKKDIPVEVIEKRYKGVLYNLLSREDKENLHNKLELWKRQKR